MRNCAIHSKNEHALLIVDATGLKQGNCGEWIRQKWRIRRGFIKLHLLMEEKTREIFAISVTPDSVSDTKVLLELIDRARSNDPVERIRGTSENRLAKGVSPLEGMESNYSEPQTESASILGDGAYGSRKNIQDCKTRHQTTCAPADQSDCQGKGDRLRMGANGKGPAWRKPRREYNRLNKGRKGGMS